MKKLFSAFLAIAMCMALALPALAGEAADPTKASTAYTSTVKKPTVKVTVGASNSVVLNPYQIEFQTKDLLGSGNVTTKIKPSVIAPTLLLTNESDVPVKMSITATGKIEDGSTAKFVTAKPAPTEKSHAVFMYIVVTDKGSLADASKPDVTAAPTVAEYSADDTKMGLIKSGDLKMTDVLTLSVPEDGQKGYVTVDVGGECSSTPTEPWAETDKVSLNLAFTFQPTVTETPAANNNAGG